MTSQNDENVSLNQVASYHSRQVKVHDSMMHYIEQGEGPVILFLHGMPVSSYVWRQVFPFFAGKARCIAVDLIGMGQSDKPDIDYTVFDHITYVEGFIKALGLTSFSLVTHGWGSVIGFHIAAQEIYQIDSLAFFESPIRLMTDTDMLSLPLQQLSTMIKKTGASYRAVMDNNYMIKKLLPQSMVEALDIDVLSHYEAPFVTVESRKPLWQYLLEVPLGEGSSNPEVMALITRNSEWLQASALPKLMMYAVPGFITTMDTVRWADAHLSHLTLASLDDVMHFPQESSPVLFASVLLDWYTSQVLP